MKNRLYYGDNLEILRNREYFPDQCVDLIYLDPPFNSNRNYNVLFKAESGADSEAQITAVAEALPQAANLDYRRFAGRRGGGYALAARHFQTGAATQIHRGGGAERLDVIR